jgi:hypothetical protein
MEVLLEVLMFGAELLLEIVAEFLFESGSRKARRKIRPAKSPLVAAIGYAMLGALTGLISLWAFPHLFMDAKWLQIANIVVTPILAGGAMAALGAWRRRREQELVRLDTFAFGYVFALAMAVVRFSFGE